MTYNDIYNLIIAAVPAITSIATAIVIFAKIIGQLISVKNTVDNNTMTQANVVKELKLQNQALKDQIRVTQEELVTLTRQVNKVINKIADDGNKTK